MGFRNPAHGRSVADHLEDMGWEPRRAAIKLAVEGNIGAGKSTFLDILQDRRLEMQDLIEIVPEPVEEWQRVHNGTAEPINLLKRFYEDPKRYAYTFQHYVLLTRMEKDRKARSSPKPLQVLERSIFSDRLVFVRAMHEAGYMGDLELRLYDSWFSMEIAQDRQLTPDGFIYLKALPETCIKRLRARNRSEEAGVEQSYLETLHEKHESWLYFGAKGQDDGMVQTTVSLQNDSEKKHGESVLIREPGHILLRSAPDSIKESIVFVGGVDKARGASEPGEANVLQTLSGVPALVLDHDQDDIMHDIDARREYAQKVGDFSNFVSMIRAEPRQRMDVVGVNPGGGFTSEPMESLKYLINDYRRLRHGRNRGDDVRCMPESTLLAMEVELDRLLRTNDSGGGGGALVY